MVTGKTRKKKFTTALGKVNARHGKTLSKLGKAVDSESVSEVKGFSDQNRDRLKQLPKK